MIYTAYKKEEFESLPKKYQDKVKGIEEDGEIIQPALCPDCGGEMMVNLDMPEYLQCTECAAYRKKRIIKES